MQIFSKVDAPRKMINGLHSPNKSCCWMRGGEKKRALSVSLMKRASGEFSKSHAHYFIHKLNASWMSCCAQDLADHFFLI